MLAASVVIFCLISGCASGDAAGPIPVLNPPTAQENPQQDSPVRAPVVMVLGDSFTAGSGPVPRWESYAARAARTLGWQLVTAGAAGTGFVNPGRVRRTFQQSFDAELSWRPAPDLLILSGGHNDHTTPGRVYGAARRLLVTARTRWPRTRVVVIGPIWMGREPRWVPAVRDAIAVAADEEATVFLDPLDHPWGRGAILPDGVHPTFLGHRRLANWLVTALREHGAEPDG
ncbi:SGNH/GDSL hydrolase family protein [Streptosporangium sp. NPDC020072]|uniref:SGNH/GDSL hydrolase family protein n=1 Tax=Streptosporangium sp. NPDC020072 TaxID=3154788 RepID=UPI0034401EA2